MVEAEKENKIVPLFFIIGRPRSGTTMLRYLLDAHPNVVIPGECNFILSLSRYYGQNVRLDSASLKQFPEILSYSKHYSIFNIDEDKLKAEIEKLPQNPTLEALFQTVHFSCKTIHPKNEILIRGDKNPAYSSELFHQIFNLYPNSKYVHLIRDYRDHITSYMKAKMALSSPVFLAISWKKSIKRIKKYKEKYPSHFYTVTYENFVLDPEKYLKQICNFIGVPYQQKMLDFYENKEAYISNQPNINFDSQHKSLFKPVNSERVGKWQNYLKEHELIAIEKIAGKTGEIFGYSYTPKKLSPQAIYLIIKGYIHYSLFIIFRKLVFSMPLRKRHNSLRKLAKWKLMVKVYEFLTRRK